MKKIFLFISLLMLVTGELFAQVTINNDGSLPDNSAMFDVKSANKGVLLPRITKSQRNAIVSPANGLMVFCTNCGTSGSLSIFTNGSWVTFSPCTIAPPVAGSHLMSQGQITWNWNVVPGATGYKWSATPDYETATDMGAALSKTETGTICNITYTRYIWAYNGCGDSGMTTLTQTVPPVSPVSPTAGIHIIGYTNIVWNWSTVPYATGYKWNTTDDYASAIEMGTATTKTETGLTCGTAYTRYVWAYNGCGYSLATNLNQSTQPCFFIGMTYGGGIIFYIDSTGQHGLIAATEDQESNVWGCYPYTIGNTHWEIGTGLQNTLHICWCMPPHAAWDCYVLVLNGYNDWFLPSMDELYQMYLQKELIGNFDGWYWSSTEGGDEWAYGIHFSYGTPDGTGKYTNQHVRAIRAF